MMNGGLQPDLSIAELIQRYGAPVQCEAVLKPSGLLLYLSATVSLQRHHTAHRRVGHFCRERDDVFLLAVAHVCTWSMMQSCYR